MRTIVLAVFVLAALWSAGCPGGGKKAASQDPAGGGEGAPPAEETVQKYFCPMHTTYTADRPGPCPICGMDLVPIPETSASAVVVGDRASFTTTPERLRVSGVVLRAAERKPFSKTIRAVGRLEVNERLLSTVSLKFGGWIERLFINAEGDCVPLGTPLLEVYSPELFEAQQSYLIALAAQEQLAKDASPQAAAFAARSLASARDRLLLWDIAQDQIEELKTAREARPRVTMRAKVEGVVMRRNVVQGAYVPPGTMLYEIADLSVMWVKAEVYEYELAELSLGLNAQVQLGALPGAPIAGKVVFIYPYLDEQTRTVSVRIEIPNGDGSLKPGMYGTVALEVDLGEALVVDDQAVIDTGTRKLVFVGTGDGQFDPREVVTGARADGLVVILEGLQAGEKVVTSAQFLVDSESRLKAALSGLGK